MEKEILEKTGYSYSGISDIVFNKPELINEFINTLNDEYITKKCLVDKFKNQLEQAVGNKAIMVSCFLHLLNALKVDVLTFIIDNTFYEVKKIDNNTIDYSYKKINRIILKTVDNGDTGDNKKT